MTMNKPYSPTWFLYNDLSQITPMPAAWDRTASGPSRCTTTVKDCPAVYEYLNAQATNLHSYVGSPLWSIVDGPWKLSAFSADGHLTFVPNKSYSGPMKPKLAAFQEMPFGPLRGYGTLTVGPVGSAPVTSWLSAKGKQGDPFPYDPGQARSLLASSGWKVVPNGVSTCVTPSLCGPGITKGTGLTFSLPYATGTGWLAPELRPVHARAARIAARLNR